MTTRTGAPFEIDGMGVIAQGLDEARAVSLLAIIAEPPPVRLERLYRRLLEANHLYRETDGGDAVTAGGFVIRG